MRCGEVSFQVVIQLSVLQKNLMEKKENICSKRVELRVFGLLLRITLSCKRVSMFSFSHVNNLDISNIFLETTILPNRIIKLRFNTPILFSNF